MGANRGEVQVFSTSFLDLLSCGMGAVIILLIIFISQLEVESQDSTPFVIVTITVEDASGYSGAVQETLAVGKQPLLKPETMATSPGLQYHSGGAWVNNVSWDRRFTAIVQSSGDSIGELTYTPKNITPPMPGEELPYYFVRVDGTKSPVHSGFRIRATQQRTYSLLLNDLKAQTRITWRTPKRSWPASVVPRFVFRSDGRVDPIGRDFLLWNKTTKKLEIAKAQPVPTNKNWSCALTKSPSFVSAHPLKVTVSIHSSSTKPGGKTGALREEFLFVRDRFADFDEIEVQITLDEELELKNPIQLRTK